MKPAVLVDGATARAQLSLKGDAAKPLSHSYFRALRVAMGIGRDRFFDVVKMRKWMAANPTFKADDVYARRPRAERVECKCGKDVSVMRGNRTHAHNRPDGVRCEGMVVV